MTVGGSGSARSKPAWTHAYRDVTHTRAADMLTKYAPNLKFPSEIRRFGVLFKTLQDKRHQADYDPNVTFAKSEATAAIADAKRAMSLFEASSTKHRRALAILVLLGKPR